MLKAFALCLLPLSLAASPDGLGSLRLSGDGLLSGQLQRQQYTASGQPASLEDRQSSGAGWGLQAIAATWDWASIYADVHYDGWSRAYEQSEGSGASLGELKHQTNFSSRDFSAGFKLYPASLWAAPFVPGLGNPQGALFWPVLSAGYWRLDESTDRRVQTSAGSLAGTANSDSEQRSQGYRLGLDLPLAPRVSVGLDRVKALQADYSSRSLNWSRDGGYERTAISVSLFASLRGKDPEWVDDFIPQVGRPGSLRLDLGYGLLLRDGVEPRDQDWMEATYAINGAFSVGLRYDLLMQRNSPTGSPRQDQVDSELALNEHRLGLSLGLNFGALPWAGKPPLPKADPEPVPGLSTDAPKQWPADGADIPAQPTPVSDPPKDLP